MYYLMDISKTDLLARGEVFSFEEGGHIHTFSWMPFEELKEAYIYPLFIKEQIFHLPETLTLMTEFE
jgi:hypothetical protein